MKPALDRMTNLVVCSLSGEARAFYDREFGFLPRSHINIWQVQTFYKEDKTGEKGELDDIAA
jgi:phosphatidylinositol 4-kinase